MPFFDGSGFIFLQDVIDDVEIVGDGVDTNGVVWTSFVDITHHINETTNKRGDVAGG